MELVGRILLMGQWHEQFYEIVEKKRFNILLMFHFTEPLDGLPTPKLITNP